ncbi:EcsC family protein [bacterium]|nr:EcsC family protein [bacterium]
MSGHGGRMLTEYEKKALAEIDDFFKQPEDGALGRLSRFFFKPVELLAERVVPDAVLEGAGDAIEGMLKSVATLSDKTVTTSQVLQEARRLGIGASTVGDLKGHDLEHLDNLSKAVASQNALIAMIEGGGCGLGGLALLAADIPLLFGVAFRVVRLVGCAYGIEPAATGEKVIAFKIFEITAGGTRDRYGALLEIEALKDELDGLDSQERAEKAAVLAGLIVSREGVKRLVAFLARRKLAQMIPLAGAAVGAGFNYMFVSDVAETARQVYRKRFLDEKVRGQAEPLPKA